MVGGANGFAPSTKRRDVILTGFITIDKHDVMLLGQIDRLLAIVGSGDINTAVCFVVDRLHANELLNCRRTDLIPWGVALALDNDRPSLWIESGQVRSEIARATTDDHFCISHCFECTTGQMLEFRRGHGQHVTERESFQSRCLSWS